MIPKVVAVAYGIGRLRELFSTKCKSQFKLGFTKVVVTRAGRLREWSHRELASTVLLDHDLCLHRLLYYKV